jgi:hypothetical protein
MFVECRLRYLDASCNFIDVAKKMTLILVGTYWFMSRAYIDNIGIIQKSNRVGMVEIVLPLE